METENTVIGNVWLSVEFYTFICTICINILYMICRALRENEVRIELVDKKKQLPSIDTTEASSIIVSQYLTFGIPAGVTFLMTLARYPEDLNYGHHMMVRVGEALLLRFVLANFTLWVSWKKGPQWWLSMAPTLMYCLTLFNYIIMPAMAMVWFVIKY